MISLTLRPPFKAALASERSISLQLEQDLSTAVSEGINYRDNLRKLIEIREQASPFLPFDRHVLTPFPSPQKASSRALAASDGAICVLLLVS